LLLIAFYATANYSTQYGHAIFLERLIKQFVGLYPTDSATLFNLLQARVSPSWRTLFA